VDVSRREVLTGLAVRSFGGAAPGGTHTGGSRVALRFARAAEYDVCTESGRAVLAGVARQVAAGERAAGTCGPGLPTMPHAAAIGVRDLTEPAPRFGLSGALLLVDLLERARALREPLRRTCDGLPGSHVVSRQRPPERFGEARSSTFFVMPCSSRSSQARSAPVEHRRGGRAR
jgi:hypothetical protein